MSLQNIKLVTFDATNTLLKFRVPSWHHYAVIARDHGFKGTADDVKFRLINSYKVMWDKYPNFGKSKISWEEWWRKVVRSTFDGQLPDNVNVDNIGNKLIQEFKTSKCWCTADGGHKLIDLIRSRGITIGVISNFDPRLHEILQNLKLYDMFDFILASYEIGYSKPDERIFHYALANCKRPVSPSECLHVGDDVRKDYEGARAAGWHAVLVTQKLKPEISPTPKHVFNNLIELSVAIQCNHLKL